VHYTNAEAIKVIDSNILQLNHFLGDSSSLFNVYKNLKMVSTLYRFDKNGDQPEYKAPGFGGLKLEELRKFRHIMFIFKVNGRIFGG